MRTYVPLTDDGGSGQRRQGPLSTLTHRLRKRNTWQADRRSGRELRQVRVCSHQDKNPPLVPRVVIKNGYHV